MRKRPRTLGSCIIVLASALSACGPRVPDEDASTSPSNDEATSSASHEGGATTADSGPVTTSTSPAATSEDPGDAPSDGTFLSVPDGGGTLLECDLEKQDCAPGFKCMPFDAMGQGWWNATGCFPVHPDPVPLGEACHFEGGPWSGRDDCGWAAVCWPDGGDGTGYCKGLCVDDSAVSWAPCEDGAATPHWGCQSCFCACEVPCSPLLQDCNGDLMCVVTSSIATCVPDASGDGGDYGSPCEYVNTCNPGLACVHSSSVPDCRGAAGCCTPYCDATATDPCPAGTICSPMYEGGGAPSGLENVGYCITPQ